MIEVCHPTIKHTNYIPTYQLQEKTNHNNKVEETSEGNSNSKFRQPTI